MRILNLGSLNLDRVYQVEQIAAAGQTVGVQHYSVGCGGKGLNQSLAAARAGAEVWHAGLVGPDGGILLELLNQAQVNTSRIETVDDPTGHAVIQVEQSGENCILVWPGANGCITPQYLQRALDGFGKGDLLLLQNETSCLSEAIQFGHSCGMQVALNASPIGPALFSAPLDLVDLLLVNEGEGQALASCNSSEYSDILHALHSRFSNQAILLTAGKNGAYLQTKDELFFCPAFHTTPLDTTAAGDTFTGYFLAQWQNTSPLQALRFASAAAALAVEKLGAASSIPQKQQVTQALATRWKE